MDKAFSFPAGFPKTKDELLERIQVNWAALIEEVNQLSTDQLEYAQPGQWSVKDHLAHLAAWERYLVQHHFLGQPSHIVLKVDPGELVNFNEDRMNAIFQIRFHKDPPDWVLAELQAAHEETLQTLESGRFEDWLMPGRYDDLVNRPLLESIVSNTYEHYQEHLKTIRAFQWNP